jgi:hypothetical protein
MYQFLHVSLSVRQAHPAKVHHTRDLMPEQVSSHEKDDFRERRSNTQSRGGAVGRSILYRKVFDHMTTVE